MRLTVTINLINGETVYVREVARIESVFVPQYQIPEKITIGLFKARGCHSNYMIRFHKRNGQSITYKKYEIKNFEIRKEVM